MQTAAQVLDAVQTRMAQVNEQIEKYIGRDGEEQRVTFLKGKRDALQAIMNDIQRRDY